MYAQALESDRAFLARLEAALDFDGYVQALSGLSFPALSRKKDDQTDPQAREQVKEIREQYKEILKSLKEDYFSEELGDVLEQIRACRGPICALLDLAGDFMERYGKKKREKNLVDFSDMEHFALDILVERTDGEIRYTSAARELSEQFEEILIDRKSVV